MESRRPNGAAQYDNTLVTTRSSHESGERLTDLEQYSPYFFQQFIAVLLPLKDFFQYTLFERPYYI